MHESEVNQKKIVSRVGGDNERQRKMVLVTLVESPEASGPVVNMRL